MTTQELKALAKSHVELAGILELIDRAQRYAESNREDIEYYNRSGEFMFDALRKRLTHQLEIRERAIERLEVYYLRKLNHIHHYCKVTNKPNDRLIWQNVS